MITFHDPRGEVATPVLEYALSYDLNATQGAGTTVALLANGFPDSVNFLQAIGQSLTAKYPALTLRYWDKGNASIPAPQTMLDEIKAQCHIAVAAYGH